VLSLPRQFPTISQAALAQPCDKSFDQLDRCADLFTERQCLSGGEYSFSSIILFYDWRLFGWNAFMTAWWCPRWPMLILFQHNTYQFSIYFSFWHATGLTHCTNFVIDGWPGEPYEAHQRSLDKPKLLPLKLKKWMKIKYIKKILKNIINKWLIINK
jgi:hypothetical protein